MRSLLKLFLLVTVVVFVFSACDKADTLQVFGKGNAPVLTASSTNIAAAPSDSNNVALTLNWSDPKYATDTSNVKYTIEIDSAGKNFSRAVSKVVMGKKTATYTAKELNNILLGFGSAFNVAADMEIRIISSYANNNERLISNVLKVKMTPYKVPPKIALPTSNRLFIVGDATAGGWNNPVPVPSQEFVRLDQTTWGGIFDLTGGKQYLLLPVNGDWSNKFSVGNNTVSGLSSGGDFGFNLNDNFPGPAASGLYKIIVDFQTGKFTVSPYNSVLPANLYIVGDATAGGWNNPVPDPAQKFTRINSSVYEITLPLTGGKEYLLLPVNGDWSNKFAVPNKTLAGLSSGGTFGYNMSDNFPAPAASGTYKISVNFVTNKFTVTP